MVVRRVHCFAIEHRPCGNNGTLYAWRLRFHGCTLGILLCLATLLLLAALGSLLPAESALRLTVREALAFE